MGDVNLSRDSMQEAAMDWKYLYMNFDGRIARKDWWIGIAIIFVVSLIISALVGNQGIIQFVIGIVLFIGGLSLHIKRFHDRGKSGWWVLVFLIPIIGFIWMIVEMGILEGDADANEYGPATT
jgi:uncharacterized membrane protein YhaH (DUF805 family)